MVEIDNRKAALIAELEISRGEMRKAVRDCEESLDMVSLVRRNVTSNLKYWLPGAALGGWVLSKLFRASISPRGSAAGAPHARTLGGKASSAGWILALAKVGFEMLRPQLLDMASEWVARKASPSSGTPPLKRPPNSPADANGATEGTRQTVTI